MELLGLTVAARTLGAKVCFLLVGNLSEVFEM